MYFPTLGSSVIAVAYSTPVALCETKVLLNCDDVIGPVESCLLVDLGSSTDKPLLKWADSHFYKILPCEDRFQ